MTHWLSYGGGVNSTALAVLLCEGRLPGYEPFRLLFADTGDEKPQTYAYIEHVFGPYLAQHGRNLEICRPPETVLERWERLAVTGSRIIRSCTAQAKIEPMARYQQEHGSPDDITLIGIDAGEWHRARNDPAKRYPLIDLGINRAGCARIIRDAGLCLPVKSGCWHCPFMRVGEIIALAREQPALFERIALLEAAATEKHPSDSVQWRSQWRDKPASYWRSRASQGEMFGEEGPSDVPCGCYDG